MNTPEYPNPYGTPPEPGDFGAPSPEPEPLGARPLGPPLPSFGVNASAELVADLISATGLLGPDRLAGVRSRAAQSRGSFAQALLNEGLATGGGVARLLATRHQLPFVELAFTGIDQAAAKLLPLHVLERASALPYALRDDILYVAIADPTNVQAIDELRLATRHPVEFGVAAREEIHQHLQKLGRESEAFGLRARDDIPELIVEGQDEEDGEADLDADDGISEAPLVRLVNSIIFQAAEVTG
jgi:type IV pilus assembly protein PilB